MAPVYVWKSGKVVAENLTYPAGESISMFPQFLKRGRLPPVREFVQIIPFMVSLACPVRLSEKDRTHERTRSPLMNVATD